MKRLHALTLLLLACLASGCATGLIATPHEHFSMRPDYSLTLMLGEWEPVPLHSSLEDSNQEEKSSYLVQLNSENNIEFRNDSQAFRVSGVPIPGRHHRCLVELQQTELDGKSIKNGLSMLAVVSVENGVLSIWYLNGKKLSEAMREDGHSGNFQHYFLVSEIDANTNDIVSTIQDHAAELLGTPSQFRTVARAAEQAPKLKE